MTRQACSNCKSNTLIRKAEVQPYNEERTKSSSFLVQNEHQQLSECTYPGLESSSIFSAEVHH